MRGSARALVLDAPRRLELRTLPLPDITDDGLVRVEACGLCGTDHEQYTGSGRCAGPSRRYRRRVHGVLTP
jgi:threonine dehydrogenase-like Zn-dependent dehydrogenase